MGRRVERLKGGWAEESKGCLVEGSKGCWAEGSKGYWAEGLKGLKGSRLKGLKGPKGYQDCSKMVPKVAWEAPEGAAGEANVDQVAPQRGAGGAQVPNFGPSWSQEGHWTRQRGATLQKRLEN